MNVTSFPLMNLVKHSFLNVVYSLLLNVELSDGFFQEETKGRQCGSEHILMSGLTVH